MKTSVLIAIFLVALVSASEAGHCGYRDQHVPWPRCTIKLKSLPVNCDCNKDETMKTEILCPPATNCYKHVCCVKK